MRNMLAIVRRAVFKKWFVLAGLALVVGLVYAYLPLSVPTIDNSPDEMSNRYFSRMFADSGRLWRTDILNLAVEGVMHPRSIVIVDDFMVPGGFIGLPVIYGTLAMLFGKNAIALFTPFIAVLGIVAWGGLIQSFFGRRAGWLAVVLLAVQPAWWYTASRTLQPNVLFASLLIAAAYMYFAAPLHTLAQGLDSKRLQKYFGEKRLIDSSFAGIFLGLALAVRLSEAYWIALVVAVLIMQRWREVSLLRIFIVVLMTWVMLAPFLITNNIVYGGMFATGYGSALGGEVVGAATGGKGAQLLGSLQPYLFPLGFAPRLAAQQFVTYGVSFFWWWSLLVVGGLSMIALEIKKGVKFASSKNAVSFAIVAAFVAVWLIPFYGSWVIHDNPDPAAVTIGASYIRYWLPIFILSTLPVVAGFELLYRRKGMMTKKRVTAALLVVAAVSAVHVFRAPQEGLVALNENMHRFADEREVILAETEGDAVVIVEHADKFIFPHRRVVYPLRSESTYKNLPILSRHAPIYYYGITFPETDLSWLQNEKLPPMGLSIEPITTLGEQTLYRFITLSDTVHDSGGE